MLRRYSSLGLQNFILTSPTTLIGSSNLSDIVVKGPDVAERHALIEYHPVIRSYWLRDLGTLGGTFCNGQTLYGMVELKPADVLKFGKSAEFIFDLPAIQPSPERRMSMKIGHSHCVENGSNEKDNIVLPIVGNRIMPKPGNERFSRPSLVNKKLCQKVVISENENEISTGPVSPATAPITTSEINGTKNANIRITSAKNVGKRSASLGRVVFPKETRSPQKLPSLKMPTLTTSSSGFNSGDIKILPQINGMDKKSKNMGNQLLQRIVRLQQELHRKDEEIIKLKENAILPSTTGNRNQMHLNEYRVALAEAEAENAKLRAVLAQDPGNSSDKLFEIFQERIKQAENDMKLSELVYKTFFAVIVDELETVNKTMTMTNARDYSDIIGEIVKLVQDPFSFRLMEITTKCNHVFEKEKLTNKQKQQVAEMFDNFLKQIIYPLSKALDTFLPVVKDTSIMARESAKACNIFSQWSREFGDQIHHDGITFDMTMYKIDDLYSRFRENGLPKHWLPPSIAPLLKVIVIDFKKWIDVSQVMHRSGPTETSRTDPNSVLPSLDFISMKKDESKKHEAEVKKLKQRTQELKGIIDQLRSEKEDLIRTLEENKFSLESSSIRTRRAVNPLLIDPTQDIQRPMTPAPSIEIKSPDSVGRSIPKINFQESQETDPESVVINATADITEDDPTPSNDEIEKEQNEEEQHGQTPEELNELVQVHSVNAKPPSEVDDESVPEKSSEIDETKLKKDEIEEFQELEATIDKGEDADDENSEPINNHPLTSRNGTPLYEESVVDVNEDEPWITGALDQEALKSEESEGGIEDLEEYEKAKKECKNDAEESDDFTAESSEDEHPETNKSRQQTIDHDSEIIQTPETPRLDNPPKVNHEVIEFWHLASALAQMLQVDINVSDIEAMNEDEEEQKRRKLVLETLITAMENILNRIKQ